MAQLDDTSAAVDARPLDQIDDATATAGANDQVLQYPEDEPKTEGEIEEELEPEAQTPAIEAPVSLNAEAKAMFAQLPEEAQRWWVDTESTRNRQVQEATTKAATAQREASASAARAEAEAQSRFAEQLTAFASHYAPQRPNPAEYADMQAFARDNAQYEYLSAQHQQLMQQIDGIGAQANSGWAQAEAATLKQALPDWFDETKGPELVSQLTAAGAELGYSPELMAQAGANDILALKKYADLRAERDSLLDKANKWDALQKRRMEPVRAARQAPPTARTGAPSGKPAPVGTLATLYPDDVPK